VERPEVVRVSHDEGVDGDGNGVGVAQHGVVAGRGDEQADDEAMDYQQS